MMKFLRKHRNTLLIVIAVLVIPFIFYFQKSDLSAQGQEDFGKFYDRKISAVEANRLARLLGLAANLGMIEFIDDLTGGAREENERAIQFIFNLLILRREAGRLGIEATPAERVDLVRNLQTFRGPSGAFDVGKYTEFTQEVLSPNGFTEAQLEELARDNIALRRIKELLATGVAVPDSETKENYERAYGLMTASVIRLKNADFAKDLKITDEEIKNYFDTRKNELKTDEKRKVDFVVFVLNEDQKKLVDKERIEALQKLVNQAADFSQALSEKGATFQQVAEKFKVPVQSTEEFTPNKPDPKLGPNTHLANAAFQLSQEEPNSEPIQVADGYYILHLAGVNPSRPLTMEEAKPKIEESLKAAKARTAMTAKASQAVHDLREGLKSGEPLSFSAEKVNLKAERVPPFTLMEEEQPAAADKNKTAEADKNKTAEADKNKTAEADKNKTAEADKNKTAEADKNKTAEADKNKTAEADKNKTAEADKSKRAEADKNKTAGADKDKTAEADTDKAAKDKPPQDKPRDMIAIKNAAVSLQPGDVSEFFPWEDGGIIVVLEKRDPPDDAKYGPKKKELAERINSNKREIVFYEWLKAKQREAGILKPQPAAPATAPG